MEDYFPLLNEAREVQRTDKPCLFDLVNEFVGCNDN